MLATSASFASTNVGTRDLIETNFIRCIKEAILLYLLHFLDSSFTDGVFVLLRGLRRTAFNGIDTRRLEDMVRGSLQEDRA